MMERSLKLLRERGAKRYVLAVIQTNATAFSVYECAGFRVTREFVGWTLDELRGPGSSDVATPRVIDFGVAKAIHQRLTLALGHFAMRAGEIH